MASPLIKVIPSEVEAATQAQSFGAEAGLSIPWRKPIPCDVQSDYASSRGRAGSPLHADVMGDGAHGTARPTNGTDLNGPSLTSNSAHRSFPPAPCLRLDRCDERRANRSRVFLRRML